MTIRSVLSPMAIFLIAGGLCAQSAPLARAQRSRIQGELPSRLMQSQARLNGLKNGLGLERKDEFRLSASHVDELGQVHARYAQYHQGLRVWGAEAITHMQPMGAFRPETLSLKTDIQMSTQPSLQLSEVLAKIQQDLGARGAFSSEPKTELLIYPETEQIIHRFMTGAHQTPNAMEAERVVQNYRLAYYVQARLDNRADGLRHMDYLVDAHSGKILRQWSSLQTLEGEPAKGKGNALLNGEVVLDTTKIGEGFELRDLTRPSKPNRFTGKMGNVMHDMNTQEDTQTPEGAWNIVMGTVLTDADNTWGDGKNYEHGGSVENSQTAGVNAAYGLQKTWDFFKNVAGRNGIDGEGSSVWGRVHYGLNFGNAFWDPTCFCMSFGDGDPKYKDNSFAALDIVAHELGHGFCNESAKLEYLDEFGGLNESNSDIVGAMVEFYARGGATGSTIPEEAQGANWEIGEDVYTGGMPMRDMRKPSRDDRSPDAWSPDLGLIDVHLSSGPMNRAFFFMADGADISEDKGAPKYLPKGMEGIGKTNAFRIWYRAMTSYLTPTSVYADARNACLRAAQELTFEPYKGDVTVDRAVAAIQNAFAGINVGIPAGQSLDKEAPAIAGLKVSAATGMITLSVEAKDNTGVTLVEFWIDGRRHASIKQAKDNVFSYELDSTQLKQGSHRLFVKAFDASGNAGYLKAADFHIENPVQQVLINGGFEQGTGPWNWNGATEILFDADGAPQDGKPAPFEGSFFAHLGGFGHLSAEEAEGASAENISELSQRVSLPLVGQDLALKCFVRTDTEEDKGADAMDLLEVWLLDAGFKPFQKLGVVSNQEATGQYVSKVFPIQPEHQGKNAVLLFKSMENEGKPTHWYVDNVSLVMGIHASPEMDFNKDKGVNIFDLAEMAAGFGGSTASGNPAIFAMDLNGDGVIDEHDVAKLFAMDLNGDGVIDEHDVAKLLKGF